MAKQLRKGTTAPGGAPTMQNVADLARVGISTVSRAFSEPDKVAPATLARIERAIARLNYVPNESARTLRVKETGRVLVMMPEVGNPFFGPILDGIEEAAAQTNRVILLGNTRRGIGRAGAYTSRSYLTQLAVGRADALILLDGSLPVDEGPLGMTRGEPVVAVSEPSLANSVPYIGIDNRQATFELAMHLGALGHRHFAYVSCRAGSPTAMAREAGFRDAILAMGLSQADQIIERGQFGYSSGPDVAKRLLQASRRPTAVLSSDEVGVALLCELRKSGISVPGEISVAGFDDLEVAGLSHPSLTTVAQPRYDMGLAAMLAVQDKLDGKSDRIADQIMPHRLVPRESSGPPPLGNS